MADIIDVKNPQILEDVVIGALKQLRDVNEPVVRERWRTTEGQPLEFRVSHLLLSNGPEYHVIVNTVRSLDADA